MEYIKEIVLCLKKGKDVNIDGKKYIEFKSVENFINSNYSIPEMVEKLNKYNFWNDNNICLINKNYTEFKTYTPYEFLDFLMYNVDKQVTNKIIDDIAFSYIENN